MEMRAAEGGERGEMGIAAHRGRARDKLKNAASKVFFFVVVLDHGGVGLTEGTHAGIGRRRTFGNGSFVGWLSLVQKHQLGLYLCESVEGI